MEEDPRSFSPKSIGGYRSYVYTDFQPNRSIDLSSPNFDLDEKSKELTGDDTIKQAFGINLRKIILGIMVVSQC